MRTSTKEPAPGYPCKSCIVPNTGLASVLLAIAVLSAYPGARFSCLTASAGT